MNLDEILTGTDPVVASNIKEAIQQKEVEAIAKIDSLTRQIKNDRVGSTINNFIQKYDFEPSLREGVEAILKASATIDDSMVVKFGGKEASVFAEEWFKTTGRAFLRKVENTGGGATNTNKPSIEARNPSSEHEVFLNFLKSKLK